jgi:peptide/nickel transport system ATP-binding protein
MSAILQVRDLQVSYYTDLGRATALNRVNLDLQSGEKLGLVGESGSGKSTMALAMMRMIKAPGRIESGSVDVDGVDLMKLSDEEMRLARLSRIAYIPQGAMNSLNPVMRIGAQMVDAIRAHVPDMPKEAMIERAKASLESVDLKRNVYDMYAHELSGGMKQRVCIAIGILLKPKVIETIDRVQKEIGTAVILIGHDMGLMAQFVDKVAVMYAGRLTEVSTVRDMFTTPMHPYAQALIKSLPNLKNKGVFQGIPGLAPSLLRIPSGCAFHPRCTQAMESCKTTIPEVKDHNGRLVACHLYTEGA